MRRVVLFAVFAAVIGASLAPHAVANPSSVNRVFEDRWPLILSIGLLVGLILIAIGSWRRTRNARPLGLLRLGLLCVGVVFAFYGAASLTGRWLGEPSWWTQPNPEPRPRYDATPTAEYGHDMFWYESEIPRKGREWISAGVVVGGLALVALASWWPRPKSAAPPAALSRAQPRAAQQTGESVAGRTRQR